MFQDLRAIILPILAAVVLGGLLTVRFSPRLRPAIADFFSPWLTAPDDLADELNPDSLFHRSKAELITQIEQQQSRIADLERGSDQVTALSRENAELRGMLGLDMPVGFRSIAARIISRDPANGQRIFRIDRGSADGIIVGQPALANGALIGRIMESGLHSSTVITILDPNCRASVRVLGPDHDGVLFGLPESRWLADPRCLIKYLPRDLEYTAGMTVVTADHDELVPAGLPIGRIRALNGIEVETIDNLYRQVYVMPQAFETPFTKLIILRSITALVPAQEHP